jgi:hypothetical protein
MAAGFSSVGEQRGDVKANVTSRNLEAHCTKARLISRRNTLESLLGPPAGTYIHAPLE